MPFSESLKLEVKKKSNWQCCICEAYYVEIHHVIPQEEGGPDTEENAAPLCPNCHDTYGPNPKKRKFIKEKRDDWYSKCENKYNMNLLVERLNKRLEKVITVEDLKGFEENLLNKIKVEQPQEPERNLKDESSSDKDIKNLIRQNEFVKAASCLKDRLSEYYYLLGYCYGEEGKVLGMINSFNQSHSFSDKFNQEIEKVKKYHRAKFFNSGATYFNNANKEENTFNREDLLESSADAFTKALLIDEVDQDTNRDLALVYMALEKYEAAVKPLKVLVDKYNSVEGYRFLGQIFFQRGNKLKGSDSGASLQTYDEAIKILEEGRKLYHKDKDILRTLSNSYIATNKLDIAKEVFKDGTELEPDNKYYKYNYGVVLLDSGEYEGAEKQFLKAIEIDTGYENALYNLGVTYVRWGTHLNKVTEEKGEHSNEYMTKYRLALLPLEKVVQMKSNDAGLWELLGRIYTVLGEQDKATEAFNKSNSLIGSI